MQRLLPLGLVIGLLPRPLLAAPGVEQPDEPVAEANEITADDEMPIEDGRLLDDEEEAAAAPDESPVEANEAVPAPAEDPAPASDEPEIILLPPPKPIPVDPRNYRLVLAGDVVLGIGGAGFIVMAAGLAVRSNASRLRSALAQADMPDPDAIAKQDRQVRLGTTLALAGGISAAVLMATGIGLIAGGRSRERKRVEALLTAMPTPLLSPDTAGLLWSHRF